MEFRRKIDPDESMFLDIKLRLAFFSGEFFEPCNSRLAR